MRAGRGVIFLKNHTYFMPPSAAGRSAKPPVSLPAVAWLWLKNFFGIWPIFNFFGPRRTLRLKYLVGPKKIKN